MENENTLYVCALPLAQPEIYFVRWKGQTSTTKNRVKYTKLPTSSILGFESDESMKLSPVSTLVSLAAIIVYYVG